MKISHRIILTTLALFAMTWILYANSLSNQFAFDDRELIVKNRFLHTETSFAKVFATSYRSEAETFDGLYYRPLVILSFMHNANDPSNPLPFHLVNVTLNALNTVLLFIFIYIISRNLLLSACTSILFAFHPLHTEAVANISGRPELLYVFFSLSAWIILEKYRNHPWSGSLAALFLSAGLFSKETAATLPFMIITYDFMKKRPIFSKTGILRYLPLLTALILYLIVRFYVLAGEPEFQLQKLDNPIAYSPHIERISTAFLVFSRYIGLIFFPYRLASDYSYDSLPVVSSFFNPLTLIGLVLFITIIVISVVTAKRSLFIPLAGILFLFPYLIVSNIFFPIGTMLGERFMYFPTAGFSLGISLLVAQYIKKRNPYVIAVVGIVLLLFSARTVARNRDWRDDLSLFGADVKTVPRNTKILGNYAIQLKLRDQLPKAEQYLIEAVRIDPTDPIPYKELAGIWVAEGRYREAISAIGKAEELGGSDSVILNTGALAYFLSGDISSAHRLLTIAESENVAMDENLANAIRTAVNEQEKGALP